MLRKHADLAVLDAWRVPNSGTARSIRKASHRVAFEYTPRPGYLYVRARAISSRTNDNFDTFPAEEIEKGYKTFLGKPAFINHHNANHRRARGVIVAAALHHDRNPDGSPDTWVELLHEIDAVRFPKLAKGILSGRINRTSMGVDCEHSICSACGNKATNPAEYCQHMPGKKGMKFRKRGADGKIREGIIHEICAGLTFFENSFLVEDPADPTAHVLDKPHLHQVTASKPAPNLMRHFAVHPAVLYHGTRSILHPGELLTPEGAAEHANNADIQTDPYVHATPDPAEAHRWGQRANSSAASARMHELGRQQYQGPGQNEDRAYPPRVYHVEPTGPVEKDREYEDTEPNSWRSAHPMRVTHEVHPLECYHEDHEGAMHWPDHPHYQFLKDEKDQQDEDDEENGHGHYGALKRAALECTAEMETEDGRLLEKYARDAPHQGAIAIAQRRTRFDHPNMTTQIPEPSGGAKIFSEAGGKTLEHMLVHGGYPPHEAEGAFVARHQDPSRRTSNAAFDGYTPGAALHPEKFDYGTLAHEAAHHLVMQQNAQAPNDSSLGDRDIHGHQFAGNYAKVLEVVSRGAGDSFRQHHADAVALVGNYRHRVHGLSRDLDAQHMECEASLPGHFRQAAHDYRMQHQAPDRHSGRPLHHYNGGDPDDEVDIYRAVPHNVSTIHHGDWVTTDADYAHQHARQRHGPDWPVLQARVPQKHVYSDENDPHEQGYQGPHLGRGDVSRHGGEDEEEGQVHEPRSRRRRSFWDTDFAGKGHYGSAVEAAGPRYADPADHPWFQAHPVHKDNIKAAWHDSTQDEKDQGKRWYPDASLVAGAIAHGDHAKGAGLLAAYSPRTNWPANMFNAARSVHEGRAMGSRKGDGAIMGMHWKPAQRILDGEHHSQVLAGPKTRAFATLIEHGGQDPEDTRNGTAHVVVDRHAMSVAAGHRLTDRDAVSAPVDKPHYYHHIEQKYLDAADEISAETGQRVTPEHVQATTWLRQIRRNSEEDSSVKNQFGGGGRQTRNRNDLNRWTDYAREHHPAMQGETMHTGALQVMAGDPPLRVPPSVDTLRPEACPVCGDQDVFKGQRCPICGFVAPPDIFRDPDIDRAREMRQQLEQGKEENPLPEGPAEEEQIGSGADADDQMFHPDQIAPDGVPGVQGDPTAPGQGMLDPSGDEDELLDPDALAGGEEPQLDENGEPLDPDEVEDPDADPEGAAVEEDADAQEEEAMAEQMGVKAEGDEEAAGEDEEAAEGGSPGKDQDDEDDDERPGGKKMAKQQHTAELAAITAQQRVVDALRRENASLRAGLSFIAELAGVGSELHAILKQADELNPAQPVPDPPQAPPTSTTEQALMTGAPTGSGTGTARGPGHTEDDPSRPGTTPGSLTAVPAEQTTTAVTPGVEMQTPPAGQLIDVTAPVQGTNPSQDGGVPLEQRRIETDVRVNPNPLAAQGPGIGGQGNDGTAFPWTLPAREGLRATASLTPEDERGARTFASIRLAKLRVQAGLVRGDELELGTHIERDAGLSLHDIEREIETLGQVTRVASSAQAQAQPRYPRGIAPKAAARVAPSFSGEPQPAMAMTAGVTGYDNDDFDLFVD